MQFLAFHLSPKFALVKMADGKHGLLRLSHLDQGGVLLVEQDLHPLHVAVDPEEDEEVVALSLGLAHVGDKQDAAGARRCAPGKPHPGLRAEK